MKHILLYNWGSIYSAIKQCNHMRYLWLVCLLNSRHNPSTWYCDPVTIHTLRNNTVGCISGMNQVTFKLSICGKNLEESRKYLTGLWGVFEGELISLQEETLHFLRAVSVPLLLVSRHRHCWMCRTYSSSELLLGKIFGGGSGGQNTTAGLCRIAFIFIM